MNEASRDLLTVVETARELGLTARTVQQRIARGHMRGVRVNSRLWLVPRSEIERWRDAGRLPPGRRRRAPSRQPSTPNPGQPSALVARLDALREASRPLDVTVAELLEEAREERTVTAQ